MTSCTVVAGKKVVIADDAGTLREYVGGDTVLLPAPDAERFVAQGIVTEN